MRARVACSNSSLDSTSLVRSSSRLNCMLFDESPIVSTFSRRAASSTTCSLSDRFSPSSSDSRSSYSAISDCSLLSCFTVELYFFISSASSSSFSSICACSSHLRVLQFTLEHLARLGRHGPRRFGVLELVAQLPHQSLTRRVTLGPLKLALGVTKQGPILPRVSLQPLHHGLLRCTLGTILILEAVQPTLQLMLVPQQLRALLVLLLELTLERLYLLVRRTANLLHLVVALLCLLACFLADRLERHLQAQLGLLEQLYLAGHFIQLLVLLLAAPIELHLLALELRNLLLRAAPEHHLVQLALQHLQFEPHIGHGLLQFALLRHQHILFARQPLLRLPLLARRVLQRLTLGVELALALLEQIVAAVLLLIQHPQIVHLVRRFLGLPLPLGHHLALLLHLLVCVGQLFLQLFLQPHQLLEVVLVLRLQALFGKLQLPGDALVPKSSPMVLQSSKSQFSSDLAHSSSISIFSDDSCRLRYLDSYSFTSFSSRNRSEVSAARRSVMRFDDECSSVSSDVTSLSWKNERRGAPTGRSTAISWGMVASEKRNCSSRSFGKPSSGPQDMARSAIARFFIAHLAKLLDDADVCRGVFSRTFGAPTTTSARILRSEGDFSFGMPSSARLGLARGFTGPRSGVTEVRFGAFPPPSSAFFVPFSSVPFVPPFANGAPAPPPAPPLPVTFGRKLFHDNFPGLGGGFAADIGFGAAGSLLFAAFFTTVPLLVLPVALFCNAGAG
uniref:Uncharacterized protein n=1 Tax=Anopheles atroparvus TaxID=41427 RepID=A0A182IS93_ANOAO